MATTYMGDAEGSNPLFVQTDEERLNQTGVIDPRAVLEYLNSPAVRSRQTDLTGLANQITRGEITAPRRDVEEANQQANEQAGQERLIESMAAATNSKQAESIYKAIQAAQQFQGMRGYQKDLESGMQPSAAMNKWAPVMFTGKTLPGEFFKRPVQQSSVELVEEGGRTFQRITNPNTGAVTQRVVPPIAAPKEDPAIKDYRTRQASIQVGLDKANQEFAEKSATRQEIIPATESAFGGLKKAVPARTNTIPIFPQSKLDQAKAARDAAQTSLDTVTQELNNYRKQVAPPVVQAAPTNAVPTALVAPAQTAPASQPKKLTKDDLRKFFQQAGGNREKAIRLAQEAGYTP